MSFSADSPPPRLFGTWKAPETLFGNEETYDIIQIEVLAWSQSFVFVLVLKHIWGLVFSLVLFWPCPWPGLNLSFFPLSGALFFVSVVRFVFVYAFVLVLLEKF